MYWLPLNATLFLSVTLFVARNGTFMCGRKHIIFYESNFESLMCCACLCRQQHPRDEKKNRSCIWLEESKYLFLAPAKTILGAIKRRTETNNRVNNKEPERVGERDRKWMKNLPSKCQFYAFSVWVEAVHATSFLLTLQYLLCIDSLIIIFRKCHLLNWINTHEPNERKLE